MKAEAKDVIRDAIDSAFDTYDEDIHGNNLSTYAAECVAADLAAKGWRFILPPDTPGLCPRCSTVIEEGTIHEPFNGNQMFACQIRPKVIS